jgi:hypothetical protein
MTSGLLVNDDAVGMLSGTDEGVFGWFTLNLLLERLDNVLKGSKYYRFFKLFYVKIICFFKLEKQQLHLIWAAVLHK